jgi:hypothetical protein
VELGGTIGNYNLVEYNWLAHAGVVGNGGSHGIETSDGAYEIIRNNYLINCDYSGFVIYGGKVAGTVSQSNYVYNNTIAFDGFAQRYVTNYDTNLNITGVTDNNLWKTAVVVVHTTNNMFVNNLVWGNYNNQVVLMDGPGDMLRFASNFVNINPQFPNPADGGPWTQSLPVCSIPLSSPAANAGAFLTTITSASGTGTTFTVSDANYFFAGMTAAGHTIPGDTIELQGQSVTVTITAISSNTITVSAPLTWTTGQGVALPYGGSAPNVGAYQFTRLPPPTNLRIVPSP